MILVPFFKIIGRIWEKKIGHSCHIHILSHPCFKHQSYLYTSFQNIILEDKYLHKNEYELWWPSFIYRLTFEQFLIQILFAFKMGKSPKIFLSSIYLSFQGASWIEP